MKKTAFYILFTALIAICGYIAVSHAQPVVPEPEKKVDPETMRKLEEWKQRLNTAMAAEQSVLRQLYTIESEQRRQEAELAKINSELAKIRARVGQFEAQIDKLKEEKAQRTERLNITFRRLYKLGQGGMWRMLMESPDLNTFLKRYKAMQYLLEKDMEVVTGFNEKVRALAGAKQDLARDIYTLAQLKQDAVFRNEGVWLEREKRVILLQQIQQNKTLALRATKELQAQDQKLAATIASMPVHPTVNTVSPESLVLDFPSRKGYLKMPAAGAISGRFGLNTSSRFGTVTRNNGIDITAGQNASVRVVADGTVRYVGEFLGYGRVVIVDHGDRYHSLYAHLDGFWVAKGDSVKAGTAIGTVGKSGSLTQPTLHFEIRHKGTAINPMDWLDFSGAKEE